MPTYKTVDLTAFLGPEQPPSKGQLDVYVPALLELVTQLRVQIQIPLQVFLDVIVEPHRQYKKVDACLRRAKCKRAAFTAWGTVLAHSGFAFERLGVFQTTETFLLMHRLLQLKDLAPLGSEEYNKQLMSIPTHHVLCAQGSPYVVLKPFELEMQRHGISQIMDMHVSRYLDLDTRLRAMAVHNQTEFDVVIDSFEWQRKYDYMLRQWR